MQNRIGTFWTCFATITAAVFLTLALSSCAVTVALPNGSASSPSLPSKPELPASTERPASSDSEAPAPSDTDAPSSSSSVFSSSSETSTSSVSSSSSTASSSDISKEPEAGYDMEVPSNYKASWIKDVSGSSWVLTQYQIPDRASVDVVLPTGRNYTIAPYAITNTDRITSVTIPSCVTKIGEGAFQGSYINEITLPKTVTIIDVKAFDGCSQLQTVKLEGNYHSGQLGKYAFSSCGQLENIVFEGVVTELPEGIFSYSGITNITLPDGLITIGPNAFYYSSLEKIRIPASVKTIDPSAFDECYALKTISFDGTKSQWANCSKDLQLNESVEVEFSLSEQRSVSSAIEMLSDLFALFF